MITLNFIICDKKHLKNKKKREKMHERMDNNSRSIIIHELQPR